MCGDEVLDLSITDDTVFRIFISEATFSRARSDDFDVQSLSLIPEFEQGVRIYFPNRETQWFLLACLSSTTDSETSQSQK